MNENLSTKWSLNKRETRKGFAMALLAALTALIWSGLTPVVENFSETSVFDFAPFFEHVNFSTAFKACVGVVTVYFGYTLPSGPKKE